MLERKRIIDGLHIIAEGCYGTKCDDCEFHDKKIPGKPVGCKLDEIEIAEGALELLEEQPEIVYCRDCEYKDSPYECHLDSDIQEHGGYRGDRYDDWFCADGKRDEGR